jgi:hypothetical protein
MKALGIKRGPRNADFQRLQREWDDRLRASGFRDVECGFDMNEFPASTFSGEGEYKFVAATGMDVPRVVYEAIYGYDGDRGFGAGTTPLDDSQPPMTFGEAPQFLAWAAIARTAQALPRNYRGRRFLIELSSIGCMSSELLRRERLTRKRARLIFARFCQRYRLPTKVLVKGAVKRSAA